MRNAFLSALLVSICTGAEIDWQQETRVPVIRGGTYGRIARTATALAMRSVSIRAPTIEGTRGIWAVDGIAR